MPRNLKQFLALQWLISTTCFERECWDNVLPCQKCGPLQMLLVRHMSCLCLELKSAKPPTNRLDTLTFSFSSLSSRQIISMLFWLELGFVGSLTISLFATERYYYNNEFELEWNKAVSSGTRNCQLGPFSILTDFQI